MVIYRDFSAFLFFVTVACSALVAVEVLILAPHRKRRAPDTVRPAWMDFCLGVFPTLLVLVLIRGFLGEPFRIPSGSMKPNLLEGDFVVVNKFTYGVRLPGFGTEIIKVGQPRRGDVLVFRHPENPQIDYIKRVVGVPGDTITYLNNELLINGVKVDKKFIVKEQDSNLDSPTTWPVKRYQETIDSRTIDVYNRPGVHYDMSATEVPADHYLVLGDNRDNSVDSRKWGFVHRDLIIGQAILIWMSWDPREKDIRWDRMGLKL